MPRTAKPLSVPTTNGLDGRRQEATATRPPTPSAASPGRSWPALAEPGQPRPAALPRMLFALWADVAGFARSPEAGEDRRMRARRVARRAWPITASTASMSGTLDLLAQVRTPQPDAAAGARDPARAAHPRQARDRKSTR